MRHEMVGNDKDVAHTTWLATGGSRHRLKTWGVKPSQVGWAKRLFVLPTLMWHEMVGNDKDVAHTTWLATDGSRHKLKTWGVKPSPILLQSSPHA